MLQHTAPTDNLPTGGTQTLSFQSAGLMIHDTNRTTEALSRLSVSVLATAWVESKLMPT